MEANNTNDVKLLGSTEKKNASKIYTWYVALLDEVTICISKNKEYLEKTVNSDIPICETIMLASDKINENILNWRLENYDVVTDIDMTISLAEFAAYKTMEHLGKARDILESVEDIMRTDIDLDAVDDMIEKMAKYQSRLSDWLDFKSKNEEEI